MSKLSAPSKNLLSAAIEENTNVMTELEKYKWSDLEEIHNDISNLVMTAIIGVDQMVAGLEPYLKDITELDTLNNCIIGIQHDADEFAGALKALSEMYKGTDAIVTEDDTFNLIRIYESYIALFNKVTALIPPTLFEITEIYKKYVPSVSIKENLND